jgi:Uncharacterized protein conserved in bacteria
MEKIGFNSEMYQKIQSEHILERIDSFGGKLYLEFGGKLFDDLHAARVLPGFDANAKIKLLQHLKDKAEIIFCISASDIERNKIRADYGITYGAEIFRLLDVMKSLKIKVNSVVITKFEDQHSAVVYKNKLESRGVKVYIHRFTKGYPTDVNTIVSDEGYGQNPYVETTRPLVVVNAPGPSSGKLATCLCQLYHEFKRGVKAGYAKFETFPIWNLPLKHPVNIAYEAATADIKDVNMIDYFHLQAYGVQTVNYNRDIEVFPVVRSILSKISGEALDYKSPTDMGVNMAGYCISDDAVCQEASRQEVIRRYYKSSCDFKNGLVDIETVKRTELLLSELGIKPQDRACVQPALDKETASEEPACAIELKDGTLVTGRNTKIMTAPASMVLNALKVLAKLPDRLKMIAPQIVKPIMDLKQNCLNEKNYKLSLNEALIALSICAATNETAAMVIELLGELAGCEVHSSRMLLKSDEDALRKIKVNLTCEPRFLSDDLYE